MISYTNIVICIEPDRFLETWPPIYRGQERPARDRLRLSQLSTRLFLTHTKFRLVCLNLYLRVHPMPSSPDPKSFIKEICRVNPHQLAPTVGTLGVGVMNSTALLLSPNSKSKIDGNQITFQAIDFNHIHQPLLWSLKAWIMRWI
jgi:hypothetical protein